MSCAVCVNRVEDCFFHGDDRQDMSNKERKNFRSKNNFWQTLCSSCQQKAMQRDGRRGKERIEVFRCCNWSPFSSLCISSQESNQARCVVALLLQQRLQEETKKSGEREAAKSILFTRTTRIESSSKMHRTTAPSFGTCSRLLH